MATKSKSTPPQDWVSPTYHLPTPTLDLDFRISCQLNPILRVGEGPWGQRNWISFQGGSWTAKWGRGTIEVSVHPRPQTNRINPISHPRSLARRPRFPARPPRLPAHVCLDKLPAPHKRRRTGFHHRANDRVADGPPRSHAAALRSRASGRRGPERVLVQAVDQAGDGR